MIIDDIRKAIIELEKKNYKIDEILLSDDVINLLVDNFNKLYGENALGLDGINTLWGYEVSRNLFDNQVVFRVSIRYQDIVRK